MINVPTHGIYFGHSMPPTLQKLPKLEIHKKLQKKIIFFKILQNYIFQKINISIFITCNYISDKIKRSKGISEGYHPWTNVQENYKDNFWTKFKIIKKVNFWTKFKIIKKVKLKKLVEFFLNTYYTEKTFKNLFSILI